MNKKALLVIDVQNTLVEEHPYNEKIFINTLVNLISNCRDKDIEVIYVQHNGEIEDELAPETKGWRIYDKIKPTAAEQIFQKNYNSAFKNTGLKDYLDKKDITTLIITGMQTEYCIDTTCKVAFEYGYNLIIPEDAVSTFDQTDITGKELCQFYLYKIWNNRFGTVKSCEDVINAL